MAKARPFTLQARSEHVQVRALHSSSNTPCCVHVNHGEGYAGLLQVSDCQKHVQCCRLDSFSSVQVTSSGCLGLGLPCTYQGPCTLSETDEPRKVKIITPMNSTSSETMNVLLVMGWLQHRSDNSQVGNRGNSSKRCE